MLIQKFRLLFYHECPPPAIHMCNKTTSPIAHSKRIFLNICSIYPLYPFCLSSISPFLRHLLSPISSCGIDNICPRRKMFPFKNYSHSRPQYSKTLTVFQTHKQQRTAYRPRRSNVLTSHASTELYTTTTTKKISGYFIEG